jgi:hypothetical protein
MRAARTGLLVSSTIKVLVADSQITFHPVGVRELKAVPGVWMLYAVQAST